MEAAEIGRKEAQKAQKGSILTLCVLRGLGVEMVRWVFRSLSAKRRGGVGKGGRVGRLLGRGYARGEGWTWGVG